MLKKSIKIIGKTLSVLLIVIGFVGFIGGALISLKIIEFNKEVPLGIVSGIVVDNEDNIYLGLEFYGKIQKYDNNGQFVKNWSAPTSGGAFNLTFDQNQNLVIIAARGNKRIIYDENGEVISTETLGDDAYSDSNKTDEFFKTEDGDIYRIKGFLFPEVVKEGMEDKTIVDQGFLLNLFQGPLPAWFLVLLGVGLEFFVDRKRFIAKIRSRSFKRNR